MAVAKAKLTQHMYGADHVYAQSPEQKLAAIDGLTKSQLHTHFKSVITSAGVNVGGSGNGDATTLATLLNDVLGALPKATTSPVKRDGTILCNGKTIDEVMPIAQTIVLFTHPSLDRDHPDFVASFLLVSALGGTPFESRLWREIREKRGLSYGVSLDNPVSALKYGMVGYFATTPSSVNQAIQLVKETWEKTMKDGITQAELDLQKQYLMGSYPLTFNVSKDLVKALLSYQASGYSKNYPAERNARINAVTLEDVNRVAKSLLQTDKLGFIVLGPKPASTPAETPLRANER
jgi:zinc protease